MQKVRYALGLALFLAATLYLLPALQAADEPVADSPEVSDLLAQAKTHAVQLRNDADEMHNFSLSNLSWRSHSEQITTIKDHVNSLGKLLQQMSEMRESASPWQQQAMDHITPLAAELASNIKGTIDHMNDNQERLHLPQYKEYLKANAEVSSELSKLISDYVSYGKSKANYQRLGSFLEAPAH